METIKRKSLLYKSGVEYADFSLNHVLGCSHGCKYPCYAYMMKKRSGTIKDYEDWCRPRLVENAVELVKKDLVKFKGQITNVQLCFATDPFMYKQTDLHDVSLELIKVINHEEIPCVVLTKGVYPPGFPKNGDLHADNEYGISIVSQNERFRERYEPGTAPYSERIDALRALHEKGLKTWVSIEPYPTPNILKQRLTNILDRIQFVDKIIFGKLNYNRTVSEYKNSKAFYNSRTLEVINFCKAYEKEYYIKNGTLSDC